MTVLVTLGPAWAPIDGMRRLTNASTGALGALLAEAFHQDGHRVLAFRGTMATAAAPTRVARLLPFETNDDLARQLVALSGTETVDAVFHAAALCDYRVARIMDTDGRVRSEHKVPSGAGRIVLELEPATKVLPELRAWFPRAWVCGWKYELDGTPETALSKAWHQLTTCSTDACVVNGRAWGAGFGLCEPPARITPCPDAAALADLLVDRLREVGKHETNLISTRPQPMPATEQDILSALIDLEAAAASARGPGPKIPILPILERLDRFAVDLPADAPGDLRHYLQRRSYEKARLFLLGRGAGAPRGTCGH